MTERHEIFNLREEEEERAMKESASTTLPVLDIATPTESHAATPYTSTPSSPISSSQSFSLFQKHSQSSPSLNDQNSVLHMLSVAHLISEENESADYERKSSENEPTLRLEERLSKHLSIQVDEASEHDQAFGLEENIAHNLNIQTDEKLEEKSPKIGPIVNHPTSVPSYITVNQRLERQRDHERELTASELKQKKLAEEAEKEKLEEERLLNLLCQMYRCRECLPTVRDREEERLGFETNAYRARKIGQYCCLGQAIINAFPLCLPRELAFVTQSFLPQRVSRAFLMHPIPKSAGTVQCFIIRTGGKFEMFMELRECAEWMNARKRRKDRQARNTSDDAFESEKEHTELLERIFTEKYAFRNFTNEKKAQSKSISKDRTFDQRMRESYWKSLLLQNAQDVMDQGDDIFLMSAIKRRAWTGNQYIISSASEQTPKNQDSILGKLKSNFGGTEYVMYDQGVREVRYKRPSPSPSRASVHPHSPHSHNSFPADNNVLAAAKSTPTTPSHFTFNMPTTPNHSANSVVYQRYTRECGSVMYDHFFQHSGSPIRIRILLPNRTFYTSDSSFHGGSIVKQWKVEEEAHTAAPEFIPSSPSRTPQQSPHQGPTTPSLSSRTPSTSLPPSPALAASLTPRSKKLFAEDDEYEFQTAGKHIERFENMRPEWHDGMNAYVLHFDNHRVREKSVKNFKLIQSKDEKKKSILQFGRVSDRRVFVCDFSYPLSPFQAFALSLSSIDPKLAV